MKIWKCPNGCAGKRGPARPRRNATVRYCLACSAKSETMVERVCESAERSRAAKVERRQATARKRTARKRERRREEAKKPKGIALYRLDADGRVIIDAPEHFDFVREMAKLIDAAIAAGLGHARSMLKSGLPSLEVRRSRVRAHTSGRAWGSRRIVITLGTHSTIGEGLGVLAHEVTHTIGFHDHTETFYGALRTLVRERWGVEFESTARSSFAKQREVKRAIDAKLAPRPVRAHATQESSCNANTSAVG